LNLFDTQRSIDPSRKNNEVQILSGALKLENEFFGLADVSSRLFLTNSMQPKWTDLKSGKGWCDETAFASNSRVFGGLWRIFLPVHCRALIL
jgi:hypothetical protein